MGVAYERIWTVGAPGPARAAYDVAATSALGSRLLRTSGGSELATVVAQSTGCSLAALHPTSTHRGHRLRSLGSSRSNA